MPDFWRHSGYHLAGKDANGRLLPTDDLLRAYFARPEVAPIAESCANERALFERLMHAPSLTVGSKDLALLADPDARENYAVVLRFRDHLLQSGTLEAAYRGLFSDRSGRASDFAARGLPPMFADQLVQMILRGILAETLPQRLAAVLADDQADARMADIPDRALRSLAERLGRWSVTPSGTEGYPKAEVTCGGVDTRDLSSRTMAANDVPGLFVIGEAVDVTGWLGGYNFQWAWASGHAAGQAV
jgi:hypothetical protein